jgi:ABC-2 type transport system ATP-binding protein
MATKSRGKASKGGKSKPVIVTKKLRKVYGKKTVAVKSLSLKVREGEIFGLLGPNGAGKTTTIEMLCGLARPTSGSGTVAGLDIVRESVAVRGTIGIVPQKNVLDRDLSIRQNLRYHGKLHLMKKDEIENRIEEVLKLTQMWERVDDFPLELSGGMKRRVTIAKALLHEPKVLFLDEPTAGLDPQTRRSVWDRIRLLSSKGTTMILTTHHMEEAELLCDRVAIIDKGEMLAIGTISDLKSRLEGEHVIEIELEEEVDLSVLKEKGLAEDIELTGLKVRIFTSRKKEVVTTLMSLYGAEISSINFHEPSLEDLFIKLTGRELREV